MATATDHGIRKLTDYQHCRLRTEMYLGSRTEHTQKILLLNEDGYYLKELTWVPACFTAFREGVDNATDEVIGHSSGNEIHIEYNELLHIITIEDNGRGIPIDFDKTHDQHIATMVLSEMKAGRNFGERKEVGGTNGIGISVVNFCSEWMEAEIHRDNKLFTQFFKETMFDELLISDPVIKAKKSTTTGTKVRYKLSSNVFPTITLPSEMIRSRVFELAMNNPSVTFFYNGKKIKRFNALSKFKPISIDIKDEGFASKFTVVPEFCDEGDFYHSDVNNIPAFDGGHHMDMFRLAFVNNVLLSLEKEGKRRKLTLNKSDVYEKLLVLNVTKMNAPNFNGQEKTKLTNEEPPKVIRKFFENPKIVEKIMKDHPEWVEQIFARCEARTNRNDVSTLNKLNKLMGKKKIAKLIEANSRNRQECVLFLMEGDSAKGNAPAARNPQLHAFLPLRGKIMNVYGERLVKVLESQALADIVNAVGLQVGKKAVRSELRYGKLFIAHDMDPDGFNIGALLINFLYTYWPELFDDEENPFVNIFLTPFIIAEKAKEVKYFYGDDYSAFVPDQYKNWTITRAKGLGALEVRHWKDCLKTPKLFPITKDADIKTSLDLIFNGSRADDRKNWMGV